MMDRAERTGLGFAVVLHAALFAALSLNLLKPPPLPKLETTPIEVTLSDEVAPVSTAPVIAPAPAPPVTRPVIEPVAPPPASAPMQRPAPQPLPKPAKPVVQPMPAAKPVAKPAAKPPVKPAARAERPVPPQRRPGLSRELVAGLRDTPSRATPTRTAAGAPAQAVSAAVASSLGAEVRRQLRPHWKAPTGADVELLRVTVVARLDRDGSLAGAPEALAVTGVNDSNRAQARLFADQAIKAVRLAAPFKLPAEFYDAWREIRPNFDRRLSQ